MIAALALLFYFVLVFALRMALFRRATGISSFVATTKTPAEAFAGALLAFGTLAALCAPLGAWGGLDPLLYTPTATTDAAAIALLIFGTAGTWWAQSAMGRSWRIGVDRDARTELVTAGPFRFIRNPIFSFMLLAAAGLFVFLPNLGAILAAAALFAGVELQVRCVEEPYLSKTHGAAYRAYRERTGRFVPYLP